MPCDLQTIESRTLREKKAQRRLTNPKWCFTRKLTNPGRFALSGKASTSQPLSSERGTTYKGLRTLTSKSIPESGLDCLICAPFARQRYRGKRGLVNRRTGNFQPVRFDDQSGFTSVGHSKKMKFHALRVQHTLQLGHRGRRATVSAIGRFPQISDCSESWGQDRA